jgi:hypothetical protein
VGNRSLILNNFVAGHLFTDDGGLYVNRLNNCNLTSNQTNINFDTNNYTIVFDIDIPNQYIAQTANWPLISCGNIKFNLQSGSLSGNTYGFGNLNNADTLSIPDNKYIAISNNIVYAENGAFYINPYDTANHTPASLILQTYGVASFTFRSLSIFKGINMSYEQIVNVYNRMKNDTLIG